MGDDEDNKKKRELRTEYPKRPFLIYPKKYNELFIVIPICFVMFFLKGGGWVYSILVLIFWFIFAVHWSKVIWEQDCRQKGRYNIYIGDECINQPERKDFHDDSQFHKCDELHFLYHSDTKRWESHEEFKERWKDDPKYIELQERIWRQTMMEGR